MSKRTNRIGRHLPTSGGLDKTLQRARELGCETVQVFVSNPQGWAPPNPRPDAREFAEGARAMGLSPVVAHAKYLINLASRDEEQRERSVEALAHELVAAGHIGAELVVVHSGSHGGDGEKLGMERLVEGIERAREAAVELAAPGHPVAEPVVENSVGAGTQLCSTFGALAEVARRAGARVCVDTAHAFVAGYDLSTPDGAGEVAAELRAGIDSGIALIHLNDARNEFGSRRDGHRRIGEGQVPEECWTSFLGGLPGVPVVMETPFGDPEIDAEQIRRVKDLAGGLPNSSKGI